MEAQNKKYSIVCEYPSDIYKVMEQAYTIEQGWCWMEIHRCELKGEQGYYEAKAWIEKQEKLPKEE